jgi:Mrp family chromosome partitioning ATPase
MQWLDEKIKFQRDGIYRHSGGPGLGKTTIATPLALGLAGSGMNVLSLRLFEE